MLIKHFNIYVLVALCHLDSTGLAVTCTDPTACVLKILLNAQNFFDRAHRAPKTSKHIFVDSWQLTDDTTCWSC